MSLSLCFTRCRYLHSSKPHSPGTRVIMTCLPFFFFPVSTMTVSALPRFPLRPPPLLCAAELRRQVQAVVPAFDIAHIDVSEIVAFMANASLVEDFVPVWTSRAA